MEFARQQVKSPSLFARRDDLSGFVSLTSSKAAFWWCKNHVTLQLVHVAVTAIKNAWRSTAIRVSCCWNRNSPASPRFSERMSMFNQPTKISAWKFCIWTWNELLCTTSQDVRGWCGCVTHGGRWLQMVSVTTDGASQARHRMMDSWKAC